MKKLNLAIIGQGRSGRNIHGLHYLSENNKYFNVAYVVEADEARRARAAKEYVGATVLEDYRQLFDKDDIDLVVNATYSDMHFETTLNLLKQGFNVMVEKPMARSRYECDTLIKTAKDNGVGFFVFQQAFYSDFYINARDIIKRGVLGDIKQIDITYSGFSRRWDWQTLQKRVAGGLYNTGPHPVGLALGFLDFDKNIRVAFSSLNRALTFGDSDDCAKVILTAPGKPFVDVEVNSNDAYPAATLKILGSRGTLRSTLGDYELTYITDGENPDRPVVETFLQNEQGDPVFCSEQLIKHTESGSFDPGAVFTVATAKLYEEVYYALTEGRTPSVTAEMGARVIEVIDRVHTENPLDVKF